MKGRREEVRREGRNKELQRGKEKKMNREKEL
jgi:hypothetical protein